MVGLDQSLPKRLQPHQILDLLENMVPDDKEISTKCPSVLFYMLKQCDLLAPLSDSRIILVTFIISSLWRKQSEQAEC